MQGRIQTALRLGAGTSQQLSTDNNVASAASRKPESLTCAAREKKTKPPRPGAGEEGLKLIAAEGLWGASREAPAVPGQVEVPTGIPVWGDQGFGLSAARPLKVVRAVPVLGLSPGCADAAFCWEVIAGV